MERRRRNRRSDRNRNRNQGKYMAGMVIAGAVITIIWIAVELYMALVTRD